MTRINHSYGRFGDLPFRSQLGSLWGFSVSSTLFFSLHFTLSIFFSSSIR
ncbi:Protein CBG25551 [Caenorhabditis briggsae]|uniref:Protein CBG25551 n=1 Tax=Caenorhabditis briggsae TaxID=6238 RepID=B6IF38_CAEBR|nr:Protein CBG25551 [Caenorhabditis briggsae]CAR98518.1 Protein CBG25551 [Caenorhabditis briggsae]